MWFTIRIFAHTNPPSSRIVLPLLSVKQSLQHLVLLLFDEEVLVQAFQTRFPLAESFHRFFEHYVVVLHLASAFRHVGSQPREVFSDLFSVASSLLVLAEVRVESYKTLFLSQESLVDLRDHVQEVDLLAQCGFAHGGVAVVVFWIFVEFFG